MLTRFDPFQELDRMFSSTTSYRAMPTDVYRRGDEYVIEFDVPGLQPDSIDVTVERNVLQVSAERKPTYGDGDQVIVSERPTGSVRRQMYLGNDVDGSGIEASYVDGVLTIHVPVAEQAKPHKIQIGSGNGQKTLTAQSA
ncbi:MAG TPA: Hsp20/alpha crystallin family protein [Egibacteraceae bacterium]|nr:Hsp20/alpha crystallin family protein [Egibacteraceae bacterium]